MDIEKTSLDGFYIIKSKLHSDSRGNFLKNYHSTSFNNLNLDNNFMESYFSVSKKNVFRGLHFQTPPYDHAKLVSLVAGEALDVVVDLRKSSKSYGHYEKVKLTTSDTQILYLSSGLAHGFLSLSDNTILQYMTTSEYNKQHDQGILWSSIDMNLPIKEPIVSERDREFVTLDQFTSPFD